MPKISNFSSIDRFRLLSINDNWFHSCLDFAGCLLQQSDVDLA